MSEVYFTYLARCNDNSLYAGSTNHIKNREARHNAGHGSMYTRARRPIRIVYFESFSTRREAMQRELQLKGWTKLKKENLIRYGHPDPKKTRKKNTQ
jgi:putative endonuclease